MLLLLLSLVAVLIIIDTMKNLEVTSIVVLGIALLAFMFNYRYLLFLSLVVPVKSIFRIFKLQKIARALGLPQVVKPFIPIGIYAISGLTIGYIGQKIIIPLLDVWTSNTLFISIVFLSLALTAQPTLDTISSVGSVLSRNLYYLNKLFHALSIILVVISTIYSIYVLKTYVFIPIIFVIVVFAVRRRIKVFKKLNRSLIISLYLISIMLLSIIVD